MLKKLLLLCFFLFCFNQQQAQTVYSRKQLVEDLKTFKDLLVHTNPVLTKHESDSLDQALSKAVKSFPADGATAFEFVDYIKASKIKTGYDDHAGVFLGEQVFPVSEVYFPFPVYMIDDQLLVNTENARIPFGSMILSINGIRTADIVHKLAGYGDRNNFRRYKLSPVFPYVFFKEYGAQHTFTIIYKDRINNLNETTVACAATGLNAIKEAAGSAVFPLNRDHFQGPLKIHTQYFPDSKTYYLQLNSFGNAYQDTYEQTALLLDSVFKDIRLKDARDLILDIRENGGGMMSIPGLLFSYLTDSVIYEAHYQKMLPVKNIPLDQLKQIDQVSTSSKIDAKKRMYRLYDGFVTKSGVSEKTIRFRRMPSPYRFSGKACLLVNGGTFSAATYFAALFKAYKRGPVIGSTAGGSIKGITAGHTLLYELPNTKIQVLLPAMYITFDESLYHKINEDYIAPDTKISFELEYPYFLKKLDWGINIKTTQ